VSVTPPSIYLAHLHPRLIVTDLDGTLLDGDGKIPGALWPLLQKLAARGIVFCPASGRQYHTLATMFESSLSGMPIIAENGAYVMRDGAEISATPLDRSFVTRTVRRLRALAKSGVQLAVVLAGKNAAYVECDDPVFLAEVARYYQARRLMADQLAAHDEILKIAIYAFQDAERDVYPHVADLRSAHGVVVSGKNWVDIMDSHVNKGTAVRALQRALGVSAAQTLAFGDYLNDLEMLQAADYSFATANAHSAILACARFRAPANTAGGVIDVLTHVVDAGN
jgi:Cof subfamily protein (haloacid dehalogenase superfamily)